MIRILYQQRTKIREAISEFQELGAKYATPMMAERPLETCSGSFVSMRYGQLCLKWQQNSWMPGEERYGTMTRDGNGDASVYV